ncbi:hypothetical protein L227DRAFT_465445, partial [Lentinus tigrinus ALCF2SS1-6]
YLKLHCSPDTTPTFPIVHCESTIFMNFVSTIGAGCAYPALTLRRCGLAWRLRHIEASGVRRRLVILALKGFIFSDHPRNLLPTNYIPPMAYAAGAGCLEMVYLCPYQSRYFGDAGSMVLFFDTTNITLEGLQRTHQPPFGITTLWRWAIDPTTCNAVCVYGDRYL